MRSVFIAGLHPRNEMQVHIFEAWRATACASGAGLPSLTTRTWMPFSRRMVPLMMCFCLRAGSVFGGDNPLPDFAFKQLQQFLRRGMLNFASLVDHDNFGGGGFHIRDDVRGQNDDTFAGQIGEQVAEAHTLLGVEPDGGFIHDQQLRVIEQRLGNADALFHPAGISAERTFGGVDQVDHHQQLINPAAGGFGSPCL